MNEDHDDELVKLCNAAENNKNEEILKIKNDYMTMLQAKENELDILQKNFDTINSSSQNLQEELIEAKQVFELEIQNQLVTLLF